MPNIEIEEKLWDDARFRAVALTLNLDLYSVVGRCAKLWQQIILREKDLLTPAEIDFLAEKQGFAAALIKANLAEKKQKFVRIKGIGERLKKTTKESKKALKTVVDEELGKRTSELIAHYCDEFSALYGVKWRPDGKSIGIAKAIAKDFPTPVAKEYISAFFKIRREDVSRNHHDWGTFRLKLTMVQVQVGRGQIIGTKQAAENERTQTNIQAGQRYLARVEAEESSDPN